MLKQLFRKYFRYARMTSLKFSKFFKGMNMLTEDDDKARCLNEYFTSQSVINDENKNLPQENLATAAVLDNINITSDTVDDILKSLNITKSCGPDLVNPRLLREASNVISTPLSHIFNKSLSLMEYPSAWKQANVVPIFKKMTPPQ